MGLEYCNNAEEAGDHDIVKRKLDLLIFRLLYKTGT